MMDNNAPILADQVKAALANAEVALVNVEEALVNAEAILANTEKTNPEKTKELLDSTYKTFELAQLAKEQATKVAQMVSLSKTQAETRELAATAAIVSKESELPSIQASVQSTLASAESTLASLQSTERQAVETQRKAITALDSAELTTLSANSVLTSAQLTKTKTEEEATLAIEIEQIAKQAVYAAKQAYLIWMLKTRHTARTIPTQQTIINEAKDAYIRAQTAGLSYSQAYEIGDRIAILVDEQINPRTTDTDIEKNIIPNAKEATRIQIEKIVSNQLITTLEPFWNDVQTRTEAVRNAAVINSNILPIGINTSNNMSMYASVIY